MQLERLGQLKNPMTSSGIELVTSRFVAQFNFNLINCSPSVQLQWLKASQELMLFIG
jgi:hypothetical protein